MQQGAVSEAAVVLCGACRGTKMLDCPLHFCALLRNRVLPRAPRRPILPGPYVHRGADIR